MTPGPVKYVAEPRHVREVSLFGSADLSYWRQQLEREQLKPAERGNRAQLRIMAADMRFLGIRFQELSFSVLVSEHSGIRADGAYLAHAFNSRWLFAFCERNLFAAPYDHGDVRLITTFPPCFQLVSGRETLFAAEMHLGSGESSREPLHSGDEGLEGLVFLPGRRSEKHHLGGVFYGKTLGSTRRYAFLPDRDTLTIAAELPGNIFQALSDSEFVAHEWAVRENAIHGKSKTFSRSKAMPAWIPSSLSAPEATLAANLLNE
jgi:hypothetical protein